LPEASPKRLVQDEDEDLYRDGRGFGHRFGLERAWCFEEQSPTVERWRCLNRVNPRVSSAADPCAAVSALHRRACFAAAEDETMLLPQNLSREARVGGVEQRLFETGRDGRDIKERTIQLSTARVAADRFSIGKSWKECCSPL